MCSSYLTYRLEVDVYVCLQKKKWTLLGWLPYPMTLTLMCRRPGTSIIESYHYIPITRFRREPSDRHWGASSRSYRAHLVSVDARTLMYMYMYSCLVFVYMHSGMYVTVRVHFYAVYISDVTGTGKTLTGTKLLYWFAKLNKEFEVPGSVKRQVMYCGPSNSAVDVATSKKLIQPDDVIYSHRRCPSCVLSLAVS